MPSKPTNYLLVLGNAEAVAWILTTGRMAFKLKKRKLASRLEVGDHLLLYTTYACYPDNKRSRIIGEASLKTKVRPLDKPVSFGNQEFSLGCELEILQLAPFDESLDFSPLVPQLHAFHGAWHLKLRSGLVPLNDHDYRLLGSELDSVATDPERVAGDYRTRAT